MLTAQSIVNIILCELTPFLAIKEEDIPIPEWQKEVYELTGNKIYISSVFHCSQDPAKWKVRLKN